MKILINLLTYIVNKGNSMINYLTKESLTMSGAVKDSNGRSLTYFAKNEKLLNNYEFLELIFHRLQQDIEFIKFGNKKILFMFCYIDGNKYSFHHNVLITNTMTFQEYWLQIEDDIAKHSSDSVYWVDIIPNFELKIWNLDNIQNTKIKGNPNPSNNNLQLKKKNLLLNGGFHKKNHLNSDSGVSFYKISGFLPYFCKQGLVRYYNTNHIKPLKQKKFYDVQPLSPFSTMDIETITLKEFDYLQIPIIITSCSGSNSKLFLIDHKSLKIAINNAIKTGNLSIIEDLVK